MNKKINQMNKDNKILIQKMIYKILKKKLKNFKNKLKIIVN